jgi:hypothetical protein
MPPVQHHRDRQEHHSDRGCGQEHRAHIGESPFAVEASQAWSRIELGGGGAEEDGGAGVDGFVRWASAVLTSVSSFRVGGTDTHMDADAPGPDALDAVIAHPVYGSLGWLAVNNSGPATAPEVRRLFEKAHHLARACYLRRN